MARDAKAAKVRDKEGPVCTPCDRAFGHPRIIGRVMTHMLDKPPKKVDYSQMIEAPCQVCETPTIWAWTASRHKPNVRDYTNRPPKRRDEPSTPKPKDPGFTVNPDEEEG